jgi:hypothetical protein
MTTLQNLDWLRLVVQGSVEVFEASFSGEVAERCSFVYDGNPECASLGQSLHSMSEVGGLKERFTQHIFDGDVDASTFSLSLLRKVLA